MCSKWIESGKEKEIILILGEIRRKKRRRLRMNK